MVKPVGPWTPSVRALLRHLQEQGFAGAPRVAGDGFTFVPGESPHPHAWPEPALPAVGALLRGLHDATASFTPPPDAVSPESTAAVDDEGYPVMWGIAWRARSASWIARHRTLLRRAITA